MLQLKVLSCHFTCYNVLQDSVNCFWVFQTFQTSFKQTLYTALPKYCEWLTSKNNTLLISAPNVT